MLLIANDAKIIAEDHILLIPPFAVEGFKIYLSQPQEFTDCYYFDFLLESVNQKEEAIELMFGGPQV